MSTSYCLSVSKIGNCNKNLFISNTFLFLNGSSGIERKLNEGNLHNTVCVTVVLS